MAELLAPDRMRGQVLWHGSDGLDGTVPGRPKGPDSGAEVSLGVRCHLGGPEGGTRYCGWATPPTSSGEPGSLRGVLDDSGMKPVRGACMSR